MKNHQDTVYAIYISGLIYKKIERQPLSSKEQYDLDLWRTSSDNRNEIIEQLQDRKGIMRELRSMNERYPTDEIIDNVFRTLQLDRRTLKSRIWEELSQMYQLLHLFLSPEKSLPFNRQLHFNLKMLYWHYIIY